MKSENHKLDYQMKLEKLLAQIDDALGAHAVLQVSSTAVILIIGQAPGVRAQNTGIPWNDPSGTRLRSWMAISKERFYDASKVALMPMGFCYPGAHKRGGDNPPNIEHAKLWHEPLRALMPHIKLILLVGYYAQNYYLAHKAKPSVTETVRSWKEYLPEFMVLPHPSWHNNAWLKKNKWFEQELLPELRRHVSLILGEADETGGENG